MEFASFKATDWQIEEIKVEYYADCRQKLWKQKKWWVGGGSSNINFFHYSGLPQEWCDETSP